MRGTFATTLCTLQVGPYDPRISSCAAFTLVDNGYDVWLGTYRGSFYGRKHVKHPVKSKHFWDFRFETRRAGGRFAVK